VQSAARGWFDAQVDRAKPRPQAAAATDDAVVIYKTSWCGVCRSAESFLKSRHVAFVEKDVEKEPGASEEMLKKARAKGLTPRGVPVIDFHGEIMLGFDQSRVQALIDRFTTKSI
jgi:glutaredoxin